MSTGTIGEGGVRRGEAQVRPLPVSFMESAGFGDPPAFRAVTEPGRLARLDGWLANPWAEWAVELYARAIEIAAPEWVGHLPDTLFVALAPGGNTARTGFTMLDDTGAVAYPRVPYVELSEDAWRFGTTLLHETGHSILRVLAHGREMPRLDLTALPHATPSLTDRFTAFDEGFAIHLETLVAHVSSDIVVRRQYDLSPIVVGHQPDLESLYYEPVRDLLTLAQTRGRYADVRDNAFAFHPSASAQDYHAVQLSPSRDRSRLRSPNQLLQSEGFHASFFFVLAVRGPAHDAVASVMEREERVFRVLGRILSEPDLDPDTPYLVMVVQRYLRMFAADGPAAVDVLLDLSHGVFVDPEAANRWHRIYEAALRLDREAIDFAEIEVTRDRWRAEVLAAPERLMDFVGPQIRCDVAEVRVAMADLGWNAGLTFDANTVPREVLALIPGLDEAEIDAWIDARSGRPFEGPSDLARRVGMGTGPGMPICSAGGRR